MQESSREARLAARWSSSLLRLTLAGLIVATVTGSLLLFFGAFLPRTAPVVQLHWITAAIAVPLWAAYLLRHYLRVRRGGRPFHFYVGVATFCTLLITVVTGVPLIFPSFAVAARWLIDLVHTYASFVVLFVLTAHLMLVTRVADAAAGAPAIRGAVRTTLLWLTVAAGLVAVGGGIWVAR